jgi:hypothetical protein
VRGGAHRDSLAVDQWRRGIGRRSGADGGKAGAVAADSKSRSSVSPSATVDDGGGLVPIWPKLEGA